MTQAQGKYLTAQAMRMALEERLNRQASSAGEDVMRLRRHVSFDRFLARLFHTPVEGLVAKGGYSLELRFERARATKDIDFSFCPGVGGHWDGKPDRFHSLLRSRASVDLADFFVYDIGNATLDLENAPYGGFRFPVHATMAGRGFASFSVDVAAGDTWFGPHESLRTGGWLEFAGVAPAHVPVICVEQQFAEKLHAYVQPRDRPNSRVKDLVDMCLIVGRCDMATDRLQEIAQATFSHREGSAYPPRFPDPPASWQAAYRRLAEQCGAPEDAMNAACIVRSFCVAAGIVAE